MHPNWTRSSLFLLPTGTGGTFPIGKVAAWPWSLPAPSGQKPTVLLHEGCLCCITHHVIKIYETVELLSARSHEVNLSAEWSWVIGFTTRPLYPRRKCVRYTMTGLQSWSGRFNKQKNSFHLSGTKPQFPSHQARSPVTTPIKNSGSLPLRLINLSPWFI
jgi:hypothetical protein